MDGATGEVLRAFVVPRGITVLAGETATADAAMFELRADLGGTGYAIAENHYLAARASSRRSGARSWSKVVTIEPQIAECLDRAADSGGQEMAATAGRG